MKILWITSTYPWPGHLYAGVFYQTQAQALSRLGESVQVDVASPWIPRLAALVSPRHALARSAPSQQIDEKLQVFRIPYFDHRFNYLVGWPHLGLARQVMKSLSFRPDIVHGHLAYPMGLAAVRVARRLGVPSVITLHGCDVNRVPIRSRRDADHFKQAMTSADQVLCVSRALGERTLELTGVAPRYLPLGIDLRRFRAAMAREQARSDLQLPQGRPVILFVGFLGPSKGVPLAQKALSHPSLAGALGVFVGEGPLGPILSDQENCLRRNSVPNSEIPKYLAAADMLILPSFSEGLPTVLVEAGACGIPIIATAVGGIPELLQDDRGCMIPPGSEEALRAAILEVLADPEAARSRAARLQDYVRATFDVDRNAETLRGIYQDLIQRKGDVQTGIAVSVGLPLGPTIES